MIGTSTNPWKLEHVYNNIKQAYKTTPLPHAGQSDHLSLLFIPVYIFLRNQTPPSTRVIKTWPDDAFLQLRDCFDLTAWSISVGPGDLSISTLSAVQRRWQWPKPSGVFPNWKLWMTSKFQALMRTRNSALWLRDSCLCNRSNLRKGNQTGWGGLQEEDRGLPHW